jgi:hypothetical protein
MCSFDEPNDARESTVGSDRRGDHVKRHRGIHGAAPCPLARIPPDRQRLISEGRLVEHGDRA